MSRIDIRELEEDTELEIVFGSDDEYITYEKVYDPEEFCIVVEKFCIVVENTAYGKQEVPIYIKDIPNLIKALQKLQEVVE